MKKVLISSLAIFLLQNLYAKEDINVYTYHNHAPFILEDNKGLTYDLIKQLNKNSKDFKFNLKVVPRSRLNYILKPWINKTCMKKKCKNNWIVLWVNHKWGFGKDSLENFSWTSLFKDSNAIISSNTNKIEYKNPSSLMGKTLAGMAGHKYVGIDDLVAKGFIKRVNGSSELANLKVILSNRADVTLLAKSAFDYYLKTNEELKSLYVSKKPHQEYLRNIMTNKENKVLINYLNSLNFGSLNK